MQFSLEARNEYEDIIYFSSVNKATDKSNSTYVKSIDYITPEE